MGKPAPAWHQREDLFLVPPGGWLLCGIVLASVALAGGRLLWVQGILAAGIGLLWILWPPEKMPRRSVQWMLAALALVPLAAYLPQAWFSLPAWRNALAGLPAIRQSAFATPQPWLTFHVWILWMCGVALAAWCASRNWDHYNHDTLARMYAGCMLAITAFALFAWSTGRNPALWQSTDGFGPFLNRNQWGTALGMAGIMAMALVHQSVRHRHKRGVVFWTAAAVLFTVAVVNNGSRGGFLVLVGGCSAYWVFFGWARNNYRYIAVGFSFLLVSFALFSLGGGTLLERFVSLREIVESGADADFRLQFYRMTRMMLSDAPMTGYGLGNFEYVLPFYLDFAPVFDRRPVHPESSFLWLASEGGWLALTVVGAAFAMVILHGVRAHRLRAVSIRSGALACALMLVVSAFFEVSGHRIGTLFPAIFLGSLAMPAADGKILSRRIVLALRAGGCVFLLAGFSWILTAWGQPALPAVQGTQALRDAAGRAHEAGDTDAAVRLLRRSSSFLPLDWSTHWTLATYLLEKRELDPAWNEFRAAAALLPYMNWIIEKEGHFWIPVSPARAAYAWAEALRRTPAVRRPEMYAGFLRTAQKNPQLRATLLRLYPDDPEFEFARIRFAGAAGVGRLQRLLEKTNDLSKAPDQLVEPVLRFMLEHSQTAKLDEMAAGDTRIKRLGWRVLADRAARDKRLSEALELNFQFGSRPVLPAPISRSDLRTIERAAAMAPMDIATAIAYYQALDTARRKDEALGQLRRIMESPNAPPYIWYLAARAAHERGNHEEAWEFLRIFETKTRK